MTPLTDPLTPQAVEQLQARALEEISSAPDASASDLKNKYLGRKGLLRQASAMMGKADPAHRPALGKALGAARAAIEAALKGKASAGPAKKEAPPFDFSLPGRAQDRGTIHPITQTIESIKDIFVRLGFEVAYGPEVERDYYNFEALNIPADHPARDDLDTFFLGGDVLMRSQTSPVQIRTMEKREPPLRIIAPGKVYRPDTVDATHMFLFHQFEGLIVDEGVTMADLKYVLHEFARSYFGPKTTIRFRPSFFPFTEPSVEVDVTCFKCGGAGCALCKRTGWIEILGAGMVDPNVFGFVDVDPEKYTGFAFGMGIERIAMLQHGIDDIRLLMENDLRFLRQF
jgi:phenylalanyl-tRNA synthetase alpha chain